MELNSYIIPKEFWAQVVVIAQITLFFLWFILLITTGQKKRKTLSLIKVFKDVDELRSFTLDKYDSNDTGENSTGSDLPETANSFFDRFYQDRIKKLPFVYRFVSGVFSLPYKILPAKIRSFIDRYRDKPPVYNHLKAIFTAGYNESQIQIDALNDNTASRLTGNNAWLRTVLSLFIILGLLGTLFGLAESLSHLSTVSFGNAEFSNESLKNGLITLLGKLGGAFAPSIWGVFLTVLGILIFAAYLRWSTFPVRQRLEYETLTNWFPALIPTPSQRAYEKLRLTERTARNVEELVKTVQANTGDLAKNIESAGAALGELDSAAHRIVSACGELTRFVFDFTKNLDQSGKDFQRSVETLAPFGDSLTNLYVKMTDESAQFQQTIRQTFNDSNAFRANVMEEFENQREQTRQMIETLQLYETAYLKSRETTDEKLAETLAAAKTVLEKLEKQSEVSVRDLIEAVGNPLREELIRELVEFSARSNDRLDEISTASINKLGEISTATNNKLDEISTVTNNKFGEISTATNNKLDEISTASNNKLEEFSQNLAQTLQAVSENITQVAENFRDLDTPVKTAAEVLQRTAQDTAVSMDATLNSFGSRTETWLTELRREFQSQNNNDGSQIANLENLNANIGSLIAELKSLGEKFEGYSKKPNNRFRPGNGEKPQPPKPNPPKPDLPDPPPKPDGFFKRTVKKLKFWG